MPPSNPSVQLSVAPAVVPSAAPFESAPAPSSIDDPVPAGVHAVIDLFANQLAKVSFPEVDAGSLRRQADELRAEARTVARAREALDAALASFAARMTMLGDTAARAVAYARIYSEAHSDRHALAAAIASLSEPALPATSGLTVNGKRRGRPPKRSAELFDAAEPSATGEEPADPAAR